MTSEQPNIVLILTDQQPYASMGCTGCPEARTPNLDALAQRGTAFDNHFVANPVCMPSRASIFSGLHINHHGVWDNGVRMGLDVPNLPSLLRRAGYQTAHFGKLHLEPVLNRVGRSTNYHFDICEIAEGDQQLTHDADAHFAWLRQNHPDEFLRYINEMYQNGHDRGYHSKLPEALHMSSFLARRSEDFLTQRRDGRPFLLSVGFFDPHHAFNPCEPWASRFADAAMPMPPFDPESLATRPGHYAKRYADLIARHTRNPELMAGTLRAFHAMMAHVDACVGRILAALESVDDERETWVIFSSDHGDFLGCHGFLHKGPFLLDQLLRVPLLIAPLRGGGGAQRSQALTSAVDLLPTCLSLAGAAPHPCDGVAILAQDGTRTGCVERQSILAEWEGTESGPERRQRCLRTATHKVIVSEDPEVGELYDLTTDPLEFRNRWHDSDLLAIREELCGRLAQSYPWVRPGTVKECGW
jgi:arylsulfatase A-like enzyme